MICLWSHFPKLAQDYWRYRVVFRVEISLSYFSWMGSQFKMVSWVKNVRIQKWPFHASVKRNSRVFLQPSFLPQCIELLTVLVRFFSGQCGWVLVGEARKKPENPLCLGRKMRKRLPWPQTCDEKKDNQVILLPIFLFSLLMPLIKDSSMRFLCVNFQRKNSIIFLHELDKLAVFLGVFPPSNKSIYFWSDVKVWGWKSTFNLPNWINNRDFRQQNIPSVAWQLNQPLCRLNTHPRAPRRELVKRIRPRK